MGYSSLVNHIHISPNSNNPRNAKISKITIHHMAGKLTVQECGNVFAPSSRQASSNYGIDNNGNVGLYVDENNRSWASSNKANDHCAVTIELANDEIGGNWHVSDKVIEKCIDLCVDICIRNDIARLNFTGDATGNLTMHKYFANTNCPGPYLESKFPYIADSVNKRLSGKDDTISMSQYTELKTMIQDTQKQLADLQILVKPVLQGYSSLTAQIQTTLAGIQDRLGRVETYAGQRYDYLDSNLPRYANDTITKLCSMNTITGKLGMSESDLRMLTIVDRTNAINAAIEYKDVESVPEYGRSTISKLVDAGIIKGNGETLGITEQTVKILVYLDRLNLLTV